MSNVKILQYFDQLSDSDISMSTDASSHFEEEDGIELTSELLDLFIAEILFESQILNRSNIVHVLLEKISQLFRSESTLLMVNSPITVVGDIHGQLPDLLRVLQMGGVEMDMENKVFTFPEKNFLFMGDYVDRGYFSVEVVLLLFSLKVKYPERVFLLRGNHEVRDINMMYGFAAHCAKIFYDFEMWETFNLVFDLIPIAAVVDGKAFCVHGGISPRLTSLEEIIAVNRFDNVMNPGIMDMLWSDPNEYVVAFKASPRGAGFIWGESATDAFLEKNNLKIIIRAHELQMGGYSYLHNQKVLTIFSASNYCYRLMNDAAILIIDNESYEIKQFSPICNDY